MSFYDNQQNAGIHDLEAVDSSGTKLNLSDIVGETKGLVYRLFKYLKH